MSDYVSHLASDKNPMFTACGEPWQGWQEPFDADLAGAPPSLPPQLQPEPHVTKIRFCGACAKRAREWVP